MLTFITALLVLILLLLWHGINTLRDAVKQAAYRPEPEPQAPFERRAVCAWMQDNFLRALDNAGAFWYFDPYGGWKEGGTPLPQDEYLRKRKLAKKLIEEHDDELRAWLKERVAEDLEVSGGKVATFEISNLTRKLIGDKNELYEAMYDLLERSLRLECDMARR